MVPTTTQELIWCPRMRRSFFTAGLATAVRPTNLLIWLVLSLAILPSLEHRELWTFVREANIYGYVMSTLCLSDH